MEVQAQLRARVGGGGGGWRRRVGEGEMRRSGSIQTAWDRGQVSRVASAPSARPFTTAQATDPSLSWLQFLLSPGVEREVIHSLS